METSVTPLSGEWKEMFRAPAKELTEYAKTHPLQLRNKRIVGEDISESEFFGARFENVVWNDVVAQEGVFVDARFEGGMIHDTSFSFSKLENVIFENLAITEAGFNKSTLVNVVFENSTLDSVGFVGAKLINVTFKNCKIYNSEIRNLLNSKVVIEGGEIYETNFFDSRVDLTFRDTKVIRHAYATDLHEGSSVLIEGSYIGPYSDFSRSKLASFQILNTKLDNVRANGIFAKNVVLEKIKSDFAIAGSNLHDIRVRDVTGNFSLGRTKTGTAVFENCRRDAEIYLNQFTAERLTMRGCSADEVVLDSAIIKELVLANMRIGLLVLDNLKAETLSVNDVLIVRKLTAPGAMAKEVSAANWKLQPNTIVEAEGSNIPLP